MNTVLVTGGTTRLGLGIAARLREEGWLVLTSSHRADAGADIVADLSEPLGAAKLYAAACARLGNNPPDELVNNAALFAGDEHTLEAVNLGSPQKLTTLMACRETGIGSVVNIIDCRVLGDAEPNEGVYARTKRRLLDYTRTSAAMFCETLRVNAVAPGPVMPPVGVHAMAGSTPLGRPTSEDVAEAVAFLLRAKRTSGCVIPVDGGQSL